MNVPHCPKCLERLSAAEAGLIGIWSCLYCEGAWLPPDKAVQIQSAVQPAEVSFGHDKPLTSNFEQILKCPSCEGREFDTHIKANHLLYQCKACGSAYLPKETVLALGKTLGGGKWHLGHAAAALVGRSNLVKADAAITVAAVVALLFS